MREKYLHRDIRSKLRKFITKKLAEKGIELPDFDELKNRVKARDSRLGGIDKDMWRTPQEVIENHGLSFETHKIHTQDGYILTAFHVFNKTNNNGKPIIL